MLLPALCNITYSTDLRRFGNINASISICHLLHHDTELFPKMCPRGHSLYHVLPPQCTCTKLHSTGYSYQLLDYCSALWGTGIRGLMRGMANLPQGNQELLVVRDKVGRPPGELGISKSMECDIFPSVL